MEGLTRGQLAKRAQINPETVRFYPYCAENSVLQGGDAERGERSSP
jgi:hypothetical protein